MKLGSLARNDLTPAGFNWLTAYIAAIDARDIEAYSGFLAEDCSLRMNYVPLMEGKANVVMMLGSIWSSLSGMEHEPMMILGDDCDFALEAIHHYCTPNGRETPIPATEIIERGTDGLARRIRIYCDPTPAYAEEPA